jgi:hypothetical protein
MSRRLFIASLFDGGLVDKHYRNVVADRVNAFALDAFQRVSIGLELNFRLASRTREYFQEFLTDCHWLDLSKRHLRGNAKAYHKGRSAFIRGLSRFPHLTYTSRMSLEFALQYTCPLRANYSERHLREWGRLSSLHAKLTTGDASAPSVDKLEWVEKASAEIERMQEATIICAHCPACLPLDTAGDGESVGCLGRINYPVEAQFEKFLADRVQLSLDTLDADDQPRLLRILVDPESPFDGEATKELRRVVTDDGLRFFELRVPIVLTREAARLTTDNIFDLLAGFRSEDSDTTTYTRELPFEAAADYYDFLDLVLRSELSQSEVARLTSRSRNYNQFLRLLTAIEKAEALNTRVLID